MVVTLRRSKRLAIRKDTEDFGFSEVSGNGELNISSDDINTIKKVKKKISVSTSQGSSLAKKKRATTMATIENLEKENTIPTKSNSPTATVVLPSNGGKTRSLILKNSDETEEQRPKENTKEKSKDKSKPKAREKEAPKLKVKEVSPLESEVPVTSIADPIAKEMEIGDVLPVDIILKNQDNEQVNLNEIISTTKIVVIFAYPKANTPGCTRQACGYRKNYAKLTEHSKVFGISADSVKSQKSFQMKQDLPFDLLSDPDRVMIGLLGGKKNAVSGIIRSHWVFFDGKLKFKNIKISPEVSVTTGLKQVLELAQ